MQNCAHIILTAEKKWVFFPTTRVGTSNSLRVWGSPERRWRKKGVWKPRESETFEIKMFETTFFGDLGVVFPMCLLDVLVGSKTSWSGIWCWLQSLTWALNLHIWTGRNDFRPLSQEFVVGNRWFILVAYHPKDPMKGEYNFGIYLGQKSHQNWSTNNWVRFGITWKCLSLCT